jgi:hypothetical protein
MAGRGKGAFGSALLLATLTIKLINKINRSEIKQMMNKIKRATLHLGEGWLAEAKVNFAEFV